jgi:hypothetical protein
MAGDLPNRDLDAGADEALEAARAMRAGWRRCGALLVFVGLVGTALQRRRAAADPSSLEQGKVTDGQPVSLPKFLD